MSKRLLNVERHDDYPFEQSPYLTPETAKRLEDYHRKVRRDLGQEPQGEQDNHE